MVNIPKFDSFSDILGPTPFILEIEVQIPKSFEKLDVSIKKNDMFISYDKQLTTIVEIIKILNKENINFTEIETFESDLEDVFLKLTNN